MLNRAELAVVFALLVLVFATLGWAAGKLVDYIRCRYREHKKSRRPHCNTIGDKQKINTSKAIIARK